MQGRLPEGKRQGRRQGSRQESKAGRKERGTKIDNKVGWGRRQRQIMATLLSTGGGSMDSILKSFVPASYIVN